MGLASGIIGGALSGLGQGLTATDQHKKALEGERLRNEYMMARQKQQQGFSAEQAALGRDHQAGMAQDTRDFTTGRDAARMTFEEEQKGLDREVTTDYQAASIEIREGELNARVEYNEGILKHYENMDELQRGKLARSLAIAEAENSKLKKALESGEWKSPMSEKDAWGMAAILSQEQEVDEEGRVDWKRGLDGEPIQDTDLQGRILEIYRENNNKWPPQIQVKPEDVAFQMKKYGLTLPETIDHLRKLKYQIPSVRRLIKSDAVGQSFVMDNKPQRGGIKPLPPEKPKTPLSPHQYSTPSGLNQYSSPAGVNQYAPLRPGG